jgi:hypothetical protein
VLSLVADECESTTTTSINLASLPQSDIKQLTEMNTWLRSDNPDVLHASLVVAVSDLKTERKEVHDFVHQNFPFLLTKHVHDTGKEIGKDSVGVHYIHISPDISLRTLKGILPIEDIESLCTFRNLGPSNKSLAIGRGLDRTQRTKVYSLLTAAMKSFDTRTEEDEVRKSVESGPITWHPACL